MGKEGNLCQDTRGRRWSSTSQKEKPQKRPTCQHLELEVLASRTVGRQISVVGGPTSEVCGISMVALVNQFSTPKGCAWFQLASKSSAF